MELHGLHTVPESKFSSHIDAKGAGRETIFEEIVGRRNVRMVILLIPEQLRRADMYFKRLQGGHWPERRQASTVFEA